MARAVINAESHSLAALSKGSSAVKMAMPDVAGKTALTEAEMAALAEYCLADVNATQALYNRLIEGYPESELELINLVIEMGVRAKLELNKTMLELAMEEAKTERAEHIKAAGINEKILASNQQFAKHLVAIGATPPTKISITTGRETTAFSKADVEYVRFQDTHPELRTLFKAREAVKSTLPITRTQAFINIANSGNLVVPLNYGSTITGRLSGGSGINLQNMPRGSALRKSITAPDGWVLVVGDLGQIEARVMAVLAGETSMIEVFDAGLDLYTEYAKVLYETDTVEKNMRKISKLCSLALQYQMGYSKFRANLEKGFLGAEPLVLSEEEASHLVEVYRTSHPAIVDYWRQCQSKISLMTQLGPGDEEVWYPFRVRFQEIVLPNELSLNYDGLHVGEDGATYVNGDDVDYLYGGKLTNNLVQATSRIVMTDAWRLIAKKYDVVMSVHDELVILAREEEAETAMKDLEAALTKQPSFLPPIKLTADCGYAKNYSK